MTILELLIQGKKVDYTDKTYLILKEKRIERRYKDNDDIMDTSKYIDIDWLYKEGVELRYKYFVSNAGDGLLHMLHDKPDTIVTCTDVANCDMDKCERCAFMDKSIPLRKLQLHKIEY